MQSDLEAYLDTLAASDALALPPAEGGAVLDELAAAPVLDVLLDALAAEHFTLSVGDEPDATPVTHRR